MLEELIRTPIVRALAAATTAGIPTVDLVRCTLAADATGVDRQLVQAMLVTLIATTPPWSRLGAQSSHNGLPTLSPFAIMHLRDDVLPDVDLVLPLRSAALALNPTALSEALIATCLERLAMLRDIQATARLEIVVRPGLPVWLQLGATLYFAKFSAGEPPRLSQLETRAGGGMEFRISHSRAAFIAAQNLARLWPCSLDAVFVEYDNAIRLTDLHLNQRSEEENCRRLIQLLPREDHLRDELPILLANSALHLPSEFQPTQAPLCRGQSQGQRCVSGPVATTLSDVTQLAVEGQRPILMLESLLPADALGLRQCGGLVLGRDGPASHIAILARSLGVAVITRVEQLRMGDDASISIGDTILRRGETITVREEDGGLYAEEIPPSPSPIAELALTLERSIDNPVVLSIGVNDPGLPTRRIGLCRSELQLLGSDAGAGLGDFLLGAIEGKAPLSIPEEIQTRLRHCLAELLANSNGALTNYRLADLDLGEVIRDHSSNPEDRSVSGESLRRRFATVRGPRWALSSGFYDWQLGMAIEAAADAMLNGPVDLLITLPSAFSLEEVQAVRGIFDKHLLQYPHLRSSVRFGIMLETPRICEFPSLLAASAESFSFGLNDLTSATFGVARDAWSAFRHYYAAAGLFEDDPFATLDLTAVGVLVSRTIHDLRGAGADGPILLCGEPAASRAAHRHFANAKNVHFSVSQSDWAHATVSCAREMARSQGSSSFDPSPIYQRFTSAKRRVTSALAIGRIDLAQEQALQWLSSVCLTKRAANIRNWKVLKKHLVAILFGAGEGEFFESPWSAEDVIGYARSLVYPHRPTRISAFPDEISCHARSEVVDPNWSEAELATFIESFDPKATLNVFPQQHGDQLCFRIGYSESGLVLEGGWGQAMYVFETERGRHPTISCRGPSADRLALPEMNTGVPATLTSGFGLFLESQRDWLAATNEALPALLGTEQLALEGYFDPSSSKSVIVDIDLPLDIAWNVGAKVGAS